MLLPPQPAGMALDFIRGNLFDRGEMRLLPSHLPGPDNDLSDRLEHYVKRAISESAAMVYAFGQRWGPERVPGQGIRVQARQWHPRYPHEPGQQRRLSQRRWRMAGRRTGVCTFP